ncbi:MAG: sigma 54-interacting transcriptional regulator [Desulfobacterium sp.]|nr:sigma 54-interacting transcriptional regulator [Desulfobacterium sp.]
MRKLSISIYVLVPLIFGLCSVFSFVVSFQITDYCFDRNRSPQGILVLAGSLVSFVSALIAYLIIRFVMKPVEQFIQKARHSSVVNVKEDEEGEGANSADQMEAFTKVFDQVAQALDTIDAEHLFPNVIGKGRAMRQVLSQVVKVARTDSTVLLLGESGTGKELIAESIVEQSSRKNKSFVKINCAAISPNLMESELFGHERGAFTGAVAQKQGCFEQANQGTLFLDEIGDMPVELQVKLLRVLQESSFFRVGGDTPITVDVRIIAATNKRLESMVVDQNFREDLFYRINVFPVSLPPLRERQEDVPVLATYFLEKMAPGKAFDPAAVELMENYAWPGNVRELENVVERASVMADNHMDVGVDHLPNLLKTAAPEAMAHSFSGSLSLDETLKEIEKRLICEALKKNRGVQVRAAEKLGINQRSLWNRVKKYEIDVNAFKVEENNYVC